MVENNEGATVFEMDLLYERRDWAVTTFRAGLLTLLAAGLATAYLLSAYGAISAAYGGVCFLVVAALPLAAAIIWYLPAQRQLTAHGQPSVGILRHLRRPAQKRDQADRDILDQLERDLDF